MNVGGAKGNLALRLWQKLKLTMALHEKKWVKSRYCLSKFYRRFQDPGVDQSAGFNQSSPGGLDGTEWIWHSSKILHGTVLRNVHCTVCITHSGIDGVSRIWSLDWIGLDSTSWSSAGLDWVRTSCSWIRVGLDLAALINFTNGHLAS